MSERQTSVSGRTHAAKRALVLQLTKREIGARYKGSVLGIVWSLLTPLFLLLVYTFVFGAVFQSKWPTPTGSGEDPSLAEFAIILFTGLTAFQLFADVVTRAPTTIQENKNYVTRVVFPLEILPYVLLGTALFQYCISMIVLTSAVWFTIGFLPLTLLLLPLILLPFCVMTLGFTWFFAGVGPYLKDINQFIGTLVSALMFIAPIFFARSVLPEGIQYWSLYNPLTIPVEETRKILIYNQLPDPVNLGVFAIASILIAVFGRLVFEKLRRGFADVI